jgi:predicted RecB family endonuclease
VRECRFEGGSTVEFDRCSQDEAEALEQLKANWAQFTGVDKSSCVGAATIGGVARLEVQRAVAGLPAQL